MKKTIIGSFALACLLATAANAATPKTHGDINFEGEVIPQTCELTVNGQTQTLVRLDKVIANELKKEGSTAKPTPFTLNVTKCTPQNEEVGVKFTTTHVAADGNLANTDTVNPATNVEIQILDIDGQTPIDFGSDGNGHQGSFIKFEAGQEAADYTFTAQYYSLGDAGVGLVKTALQYDIAYQ